MSFEAINTVREAEERAKQIKLEATQAAAEAIEAAERDGKEAVEAALNKAREELKSLRSKTDEKATQDAEALAATTKIARLPCGHARKQDWTRRRHSSWKGS